MGRGRQKAKQAKVARELKYDSGSIDLNALAAELHGAKPSSENNDLPESDYSEWIEDEEESEED